MLLPTHCNAMFSRILLSCFILFASSASAEDVYFEALDNETNSVFGTIVELNTTHITIDVQGESQTIPLEKLVKIRNLASSPYEGFLTSVHNQNQPQPSVLAALRARSANERKLAELFDKIQRTNEQAVRKTLPGNIIALELNDGSRLTSTSFAIRGDQCEYRLLEHERYVNIPMGYLSSVRFFVRSLPEVFNPPEDWQRLAVPNAEGDRLVVGNSGAFDVYTGILGEVSHENASFNVDGETLPIPRRRVAGLVFHKRTDGDTGITRTAPLATLTLWGGTQGMVTDIGLNKTEQGQAVLTWQTILGWSDSVPLDMVSEIDFGEKGVAYLFDFERTRNDFSVPFASELKAEPLQLLQKFYGSRSKASREIVMDDIAYDRGVTLQGKTSLEYRLPKPFASLTAVVGTEDQFRPHSSATLQILADTQLLGTWELHGDAAAQPIQLNLPLNCQNITIMVESVPQSVVPTVLTIVEPKLLE